MRPRKYLSMVMLLFCTVFLILPLDGHAQKGFPSLDNLRQRNVALEMQGFQFASGLRRDSSGRPNGNGFDLVSARWYGSGFIAGQDGSVVTNYHVARRALRGRAIFDDGGSYEIRHIKVYDRRNDLAILKIRAQKPFPTVALGNSEYVNPLDRVLAVGNPQGMGINMTEGQVSQVVRDDFNQVSVIRHTAPITSGNSGGALYKERYVVGVNASVLLASYGGPTGINQAIPINKAKLLLQKYKRIIPLEQAFPTNVESIIKNKFRQIDAKTAQIPGAKSQKKPGTYPFNFGFGNLQDYLIIVECPGRDLALGVINAKGQLIGFGDLRKVNYEGLMISSNYAQNIRINVVNFDPQPANFGIRIGYVSW